MRSRGRETWLLISKALALTPERLRWLRKKDPTDIFIGSIYRVKNCDTGKFDEEFILTQVTPESRAYLNSLLEVFNEGA